ncbi:MAG TPA: PAC2 family protein [Anaerolineales bacterium]|nr:PAC2 family protein [Anaerolineales bacterium]
MTLELLETPQADEVYMLAGWRQWADAGSVSSGLPEYLIQRTKARRIGTLGPDGFYLFQFPGTHDLVRPVVKFDQGYAESLEVPRNEIFYSGNQRRGMVFFIGDEPHMDVERYAQSFLKLAETLKVKRIIGFGGVYGELPYDKERMVSGSYSLRYLKEELNHLALSFSDYHGGASIGSYICRRAGEKEMEYVAMYAFVPMYDFSAISQLGNTVRIENDYMAWLGIMRRVNYMLKLDLSLKDLERRTKRLLQLFDEKVDELERNNPQLGVRNYLQQLSEGFTETIFEPLEDVWEEELNRLFNKFDDGEGEGEAPDEAPDEEG